MDKMRKKKFDVALSFGREDRKYAEGLALLLEPYGVHCFYDQKFTVETWGENLTEYFVDLYRNRARFVVSFLSRSYLRPWPTLEKRAALAEALQRSSPYLLPVRIDDTDIPGILSTLGVIDLRRHPLEFVRDAVLEKLKEAPGEIEPVPDQVQHLLAILKCFPAPVPLSVIKAFFAEEWENIARSLDDRYTLIEDGTIALLSSDSLAPDGVPTLERARLGRHLCNFAFEVGRGTDSSELETQIDNIFASIDWATENYEFELILDFFPQIEKCLKLAGDKNRLLNLSTTTIKACHQLKELPALREKATRMEARAKICGLTWVYQRIGRLDAALQELKEGLELCEAIGDQESILFGKKCMGRLNRLRGEYEESIGNLTTARNEFSNLGGSRRVEVGDCISLLARTYFERAAKLGDEQGLRRAEKLQQEAYGILKDFPNTKDLADCLILEGDILAAMNLSGADSCYKRAKAQISSRLWDHSEVYARACLQLGRWYASKGMESPATQELQSASDVYDRLVEAENVARAQLVLARLAAEKVGQGQVFQQFARVAKSESSREVRLLAWNEHRDKLKQYVGVKRAGGAPDDQYWHGLLRRARENWALKERSRHE